MTYYADVRISQMQPSGFRTASWDPPPGQLNPAFGNATTWPLSVSQQQPDTLGGLQGDLNHLLPYVTYTLQGTWDGQQCSGTWIECGHTILPEGQGSATFVPCIATTPYTPNPPDCTGACEQPVVNLVGQLGQAAFAGTVQRWPQPAQPPMVGAVVNLPVQFFIPDWRLNGDQQSVIRQGLILVGPPDDHGRSRAFTYVVTAGLQAVDWNFGDGETAHFGDAGGFGQNVYPP
ncbi:MAG: hypothetical protein J2P28_24500, partial [Actinobacteria bacterium]|nr:hypothetical protein [Actinomycetota bacterium]